MKYSINQWLGFDDNKRTKIIQSLNLYNGEGEVLIKEIVTRFRNEFRDIPNLEISGAGNAHSSLVIAISHPFIFDRRKYPDYYLGIPIRVNLTNIPKQFQVKDHLNEYAWSPDRYENFILENAKKVRQSLGNQNMTEKDMLDALVGQDYAMWVKTCEDLAREGKIPPFQSKYSCNKK